MQLRKSDSSSKNDKGKRSVENSAKTLLANIRFMSVDEPIRTVVITSTIPNEGKTFVAINLAQAMATSGIRTLLVECDMRRRSVAKELNIHARHGLYSVVSGEVSLQDAVVPTMTHRLHFLDAEPHIPNPSDLLSAVRFTSLIEEAKKEFDYVVFDTPPVGTFVDAAVLGAKVDAVFMVVREQFARKDDVARAAEQLKTANVPLAGLVMNFCESSSNSYYYYDYYYREDKGDPDRFPRHVAPMDKDQELEGDSEQPDASSFYDTGFINIPSNWDNAPDLDGGLAESDGSGEVGSTGKLESVDRASVAVEFDEAKETAPKRRPRFSTGTSTASRFGSKSETAIMDRDRIRRKIDADS